MNKNFGEWYRGAALEPENERLKNRWKGVQNFIEVTTPNDIINLVKLFFNIPAEKKFLIAFIDSFTEEDAAFPRKCMQELSVLSGAALNQIVESQNDMSIFAELLVYCAAIGSRRPAVQDIYDEIISALINQSANIREKERTLAVSSELLEIPDSSNIIEQLDNEQGSWTEDKSNTFLKYISDLNNFLIKVSERLNGSNEFAEIYFEDSQILWWLIGGWSRDLEKPYKNFSKKEVALIIGKELADLVSVLPGPYSADGVIGKQLDNCKKGVPSSLSLEEVVNNTIIDWKIQYAKEDVNKLFCSLIPISTALKLSAGFKEWQAMFNEYTLLDLDKVKLSAQESSVKMYMECLAVKCYKLLLNEE